VQSNRSKGKRNNPISVDESTFAGLEAEWGKCTRWMQVVAWVVARSRRPEVMLSYVAIIVALILARVRASDTLILSIAILSIAVIAIVSEWTGGKLYGYTREREAASQHAAKDKRIT
jgi:type III secretory pathway component EscS